MDRRLGHYPDRGERTKAYVTDVARRLNLRRAAADAGPELGEQEPTRR